MSAFSVLCPLLGSVLSNAGICSKHCLGFPGAPPLLPACSPSPQISVDLQSCSRCSQNWKKVEWQSSVSTCHLYALSKCCLNRRNSYLLLILVYINSVNIAKKQTNTGGFAQAVKIETKLQFLLSQFFVAPQTPQHFPVIKTSKYC